MKFYFNDSWYKLLYVFKSLNAHSIAIFQFRTCFILNMITTFTNRLIKETSPYLLQHAHNPVDWFAWGDEALQKAKSENKVILVSIGYSACHWCHVMERESFENEATALVMNNQFVNIKVDREERPDLDHIFMDAVQAISGSGGWPLNVFLTPDGKPFYGGTYYPPVKAFNRSSWTEVLQGVFEAWSEKQNEIESQADNLLDHLSRSNSNNKQTVTSIITEDKELFFKNDCDNMSANIMKAADKTWGGFGNAPKFPQTFILQYLLQYSHLTGNEDTKKQAFLSLDKMLQGGIYDHIDGGIARYSTDVEWLAPHFEKMLYDNALLIDVLCDAWQISNDNKYKEAIFKTISFIENELTDKDGAFYAALDADSEGIEGKYYVWQKEEIDEILGLDAKLFNDYFDISENGNWEDSNILRILIPFEEFAYLKNIEINVLDYTIKNCIKKLSVEREKRIKPALDDKIILSWNALALKAIAKAAIVLSNEHLKLIAKRNFQFLERKFLKKEGSEELMHTYKNGIAKYSAFLDDYAYFINACLHLYELEYDVLYLEKAKKYAYYVIENFSDAENVFFYFTNKQQNDIILRKKEIHDGATPSGNSVMAFNLSKLSIIFNIPEWNKRSLNMLKEISISVTKFPQSFAIWASLLQQNVFGLNEIAIVGKGGLKMCKALSLNYIPYKIVMVSEDKNEEYALLKGKPFSVDPLIYLCKNYHCLNPFKTNTELLLYIKR